MSAIARLPSQFIYPAATAAASGDLLVIQKSGELWLRAIDPTTLGYLKASGGFVDAESNVLKSGGIAGRQGSSGVSSSTDPINFWWASPSLQAWVGATNLGNLALTPIATADLALESTSAMTSASQGSTTLTNKSTDYTVISHVRTIAVACNALWTVQIDWEHVRSQGVQPFGIFATVQQITGGVTTALRYSWVHYYEGIPAIATGFTSTTISGTNYPGTFSGDVGHGQLTMRGIATLTVPLSLLAGSTTLQVLLQRQGTHSSSAKSLATYSTLVELRR